MKDKVIVGFIKKNWIGYLLGIVFLVAYSYIQSLSPKLLGMIIDHLSQRPISTDKILYYISLLMVVAFLAFFTRFTWRNYIIGNARNLECYLRQKLFSHFQTLPVQFYNNSKTGDLMAYAINDISAIRMAFGPGMALVINGVGISTISVISMVRSVNLRLTFFSLLPIPVIVYLLIKIGSLVQVRFRTVQENFAKISDRVQENISGIRVIKTYVQEQEEVKKFDQLNKKMIDSNIKMVRVSSLLSPSIEICFGVSFMINLIYGSSLVRSGVISIGDFVAFNGYLAMIMTPIVSIGRVINISQKGLASYKRLMEIFKISSDINDDEADRTIAKLKGAISIKNLTFTYPDAEEPAIEDININIAQGKILGIIGKTGSGKTTLVNLLLRLYKLESGKISIGGIDINKYPLAVLRETIGYVPQDNFLFSATIKDNINFFRDNYKDEAIEDATKLSCIYDSIAALNGGFETVIGERGVNLSGGQKQRISIARAILKDPSVIILDDALSAVDTKTEEQIIENLKQAMDNKTGIIIAHRISAIKHADEIAVMEKGRIVEKGSHEELIEKKGAYFEIYKEQFKEDVLRRVESYAG